MVVALAASALVAQAPEVAADDEEPTAEGTFPLQAGGGLGTGAEIESMRTATSRTYATDLAGVFRTVESPAPVSYVDDQGDWQDIDTTLVVEGDGNLHAASAETDVVIATDSADDQIATITGPDGSTIAFGVDEAASVDPVVDGSTATFDEIVPGASIELTAVEGGVKESIVLESPSSTRSFVFPLQLDGATAQLTDDGSIEYLDASGERVALTPAGYMVDASQVSTTGVEYSLEDDGSGGTQLRVALDGSWLDDPQRVYPVTVDPTTYTEPHASLGAASDDTYVVQGGSSTDRSAQSVLKVGYSGSAVHRSFIHRSFIHFPAMDDFVGMNILEARLDLTQVGGATCTGAGLFEAYTVAEAWNGTAVTTHPGPVSQLIPEERIASGGDSSGHGASSSCAAAGTETIMLTPAAWQWTEGQITNDGILLKAVDEASSAGYREFASTDAVNATQRPQLELLWSDPSASGVDAPRPPMDQTPSGRLSTATPTLSATYEDEQGDDGHIEYFVYNRENYYWGFAAGDVVDAGDPSAVAVTSPTYAPLPTDVPFVMRSAATEGAVTTSGPPGPHSPLSAPADLEVPSTKLTAPTDGATVSGTATLTASAPATVGSLSLTHVEFVVDGAVVATDTSSPYSISGPSSNLTNGSHVLEARSVYGTNQRTITSAQVVITVANDPCPADDSFEENDTKATATDGSLLISGAVCPGDADWYSFDYQAGDEVLARLDLGDSSDSLSLGLYNASSTQLATASGTEDLDVEYTIGSSGTYFVRVVGTSSSDSAEYELVTSYDVDPDNDEESESSLESASPLLIGMNTQFMNYDDTVSGYSDYLAEFQRMREAGIKATREGFEWSDIEPTNNGWTWTTTDAFMGAAADAGIQVLRSSESRPRVGQAPAQTVHPTAESSMRSSFGRSCSGTARAGRSGPGGPIRIRG